MRIIFDARALTYYPGWAFGGFHAATEDMVMRLAKGLADSGHTTHVITPDLPVEMQGGPYEWYWGPSNYPKAADVLVPVHSMEGLPTSGITAPIVAMMTNGIGFPMLPDDQTRQIVDVWPCLSKVHKKLLCKAHPAVDPQRCVVTGLGVDLAEIPLKAPVPGRLLYANDPQRGLWHMLDIYDALRAKHPEISLHVTYEFDKQFEPNRWAPAAITELLWECKDRMQLTPGISNLSGLDRAAILQEIAECDVHAMPSDPPNVGSQLHGVTQLELAAAGTPLVLSDTEAFPEIFGEGASILPPPGAYVPDAERRADVQDWADAISELIEDPEKYAEAADKARKVAERHTWDRVIANWNQMLAMLMEEAPIVPGD